MDVRHCIMVCDSAAHSGGVSAVMLQQAIGLRAAGVRVHVFAACGPVAPALLEQSEAVVCMRAAPARRERLTEIWNRAAARALEQFLAGFSVADTVVHVHALSMGLSPSIAQALHATRMSYVITAHDASWACPTGHFYHFGKARPCTLEPLSMACLASQCDQRSYLHKLYKVIKMVAMDHVSHLKRDACAIIVPSALLRQRVRSRVPADTPVITLLNPVNAADLGPREHRGARFLFVGRVWEEKGILQLLQVIGERYPLTVVGDGPLLPGLAQRYPRVLFKGWLPPEQVAREMRDCLALILPTVSMEAFGLVVAEALALGVPVVVSDRAGAASMVKQGVNGFVVDMARPAQLLASCAALMDERSASRMSLQAYLGYWREPLSTRVYVAGLLDIYRAIGRPAAAGGS